MKNGWDGVRRAGFTIIEVMLFLAISGFLLVGILAGTGAGIARQRYNDSVQNVAQILREQYSAVINTQIAERENSDVCYSPSPDELMSGGQITDKALANYYDGNGNLKVNNGRGRTACLVYGVMITLGGDGGEVVQASSLIGKDIDAYIKERKEKGETYSVDGKSDLEVLKDVGVNNLSVFYEYRGPDDYECYVRTTEGSFNYNLQWKASTQALAKNTVLEATIIIVRSPIDGAVRTYVADGTNGGIAAIRYDTGDGYKVVNYASINGENGGRGWGLQSKTSGACGGTIGSNQGGFGLLKNAGINGYLTEDNFRQKDLNICVGTEDLFVFASRRRMVTMARDGHNSGAVELIEMDTVDANGVEKNLCE